MTKGEKVTAIVPCFNEGEVVGEVLGVLSKSPYLYKVVAVNDGSTDDSEKVIKSFKNVGIVNLKKNLGKGGAVREGVKKVKTKYVFLCDADLKGWQDSEINKLIKPVLKEKCDICVGITDKGGRFGNFIRQFSLPLISGQRVLKTQILKKVVSSPFSEEYGLEVYMNYYARLHGLKLLKVGLVGIRDKLYVRKRGWLAYFKKLGKYFHMYSKIALLNLGVGSDD